MPRAFLDKIADVVRALAGQLRNCDLAFKLHLIKCYSMEICCMQSSGHVWGIRGDFRRGEFGGNLGGEAWESIHKHHKSFNFVEKTLMFNNDY